MSKVKKLGLTLSKRYESFVQQKIELMNHPKMIEYLYNKPIINVREIEDLVVDHDSTVRLVRLDMTQLNLEIRPCMFMLREIMRLYDETYHSYCKHTKKNNIMRNLAIKSDLSSLERSVYKFLEKCEQRNLLSYLYKWSFVIPHHELTSVLQKYPINYTHPQVYDFYGMIFSHKQLVQFVIMCDDDTHYDDTNSDFMDIHLNDIILQFILFQMNIHLLRLNKRSLVHSQIKKFLKKINNSTEYVCIGAIQPQLDIIKQFEFHQDSTGFENLTNFLSEYRKNHIAYNKQPKSNDLSDSDDEYYQEKTLNNISDDPSKKSYTVSQDIINKIIQDKEQYKLPKSKYRPEVEQIFVELVGKKQ